MCILYVVLFLIGQALEKKFYNIFNFKSLIHELARIEPPSAIFLSIWLKRHFGKSDKSDSNVIKVTNALKQQQHLNSKVKGKRNYIVTKNT